MRPRNLQWCDAISESRRLPPRAKVVGMAMATRYAGHETLGDIRPGTKRLAKDAGLSVTTVDRALKELREAGFIVKVRNGGEGVCTLYRGCIPTKAKPETALDAVCEMVRTHVTEHLGATVDELAAWAASAGVNRDDLSEAMDRVCSIGDDGRFYAEQQ